MQPVPATVPERLSISAAACSDAAEITDMTPLASLVPSDRHIIPLIRTKRFQICILRTTYYDTGPGLW